MGVVPSPAKGDDNRSTDVFCDDGRDSRGKGERGRELVVNFLHVGVRGPDNCKSA